MKTVGPLRPLLLFVCGLALCTLPVRAAVLIHEYALRGSLADNKGGPALTTFGGQVTALGYVFSSSQGVGLTAPSLTPADYSLEFSFRLNSTVGTMKLLDVHNLGDRTGLYQIDGRLSFEPVAKATNVNVSPGNNAHVVVTRSSATNVVSTYVNGQLVFSFNDTGGAGVVSANRQFLLFRDQFATGVPSVPASGTLNYARVFNGALTAGEVSALFSAGPPLPPLAPIPEPSTTALLITGIAVFAFSAHRRRKSRSRIPALEGGASETNRHHG